MSQILFGRLGSSIAEDIVVGPRSSLIAMPFNGHASMRASLEPLGIGFQNSV